MATKEIAGKQIEMDGDDHVKNYQDWEPAMAEVLAKEEGIDELTDASWKVINYMRDFYSSNGEIPTMRKIGKESGVTTKDFYALFPKGPAKKAARIGGLPKPHGCI